MSGLQTSDPPPHEIERYKAIFDYHKHLTTLSTGSIVLIATFLEKLFAQPEWKPLVVVSLVGFMASVIGSIINYTALIFDFPKSRNNRKTGVVKSGAKKVVGISLYLTWLGFLTGVISLSIFAIKNLSK
jgi:4-hydroxybenzoate polyprenyltransferase